jgi:hypothetical protein
MVLPLIGLTGPDLLGKGSAMKTKRPMKKRGRKKSGQPLRTLKIQCSLTPDDAEWLNEYAKNAGFVSRSQLITCVLERLIICGFSPVGALRMASQIQHKQENFERKTGTERPLQMDWNSLRPRPFPALPEDAPFDPEAERSALEELHNQPQPQS